jgi:hypothetical protein
MTATETTETTAPLVPPPTRVPARPRSPWWIVAFAVALLLMYGWSLMAHPTYVAPTRDPAWYTWRANVILQSDPGSVAAEWGPRGIFSGGYRVGVPMMGALIQRVAGVDSDSFTSIMMVGMPVLTGLALGAAAFRSRRDELPILLMMLAAAALFLTQPYIGYLDDATVLFLLSLSLAFVRPARESWGARAALFAIGLAAAFVHPTSAAVFGATLVAVFGLHLLTSRFRLGEALRSDGPMLMSVGIGMVIGLACWPLGIWGPSAKLSDAALPPPYSQRFFLNRLGDWVLSMRPLIIVPLIIVAIGSAIWTSRRRREPAEQFRVVSALWLLPLAGGLTFLVSSKPVPYYRFMNASAAPIALAGTGAFVAVRWFLGLDGRKRAAGVIAAFVVVGSLGWMVADGLHRNWSSARNQWAVETVRTSLAAVHEVAAAAGPRPVVLIMNYGDEIDPTDQTNTAYGWAKTDTNVFRTALPGELVRQQATYVGTVANFLAGRQTTGASDGYNRTTSDYWAELQVREQQYPQPPLVFVMQQFYKGATTEEVAAAMAQGTEIGPGVVVLNGSGLYAPPSAVVAGAEAAGNATEQALATHPGPFANPLHTLRVLFGLFLLVMLPGLIAASFFELEDATTRVMLVPGMSIVLTILSGIAVLAVWRGPLTTAKGWTVVAVAVGLAVVLRAGRERIVAMLSSFGGFFNRMFAVFSDRSFAALMSTQFLAQAADGVVQASLAKTIAFGGKEGFDLTTAPSTRYLLAMVLLLYVPYTLVSPFMGVLIDRSDRRRLLSGSNLFRAGVVGVAALALAAFGSSLPNVVLIGTILVALACTRILLAIKSAGLPAVLRGKDLLQGNGLSQAGGAVFQVVGGGVALVATAVAPSWTVALVGAAMYGIAGLLARRVEHLETERATGSISEALRRVLADIRSGVGEVFSRPPAALGLTAFQALRMEFFGFVALVFALQARFLLTGAKSDKTAVAIAAATGALGAATGMVLAQKLKERVPPARLLVAAMFAVGVGVIAFGGVQTIAGYSALTFVGALGFFLGKISADTIMQQSLPDGFRGRGFSLFDIAYNLGWIVPALVLAAAWGDGTNVRVILIGSGAVFLLVTALIARWASRIKDQLAPQDDLVVIE